MCSYFNEDYFRRLLKSKLGASSCISFMKSLRPPPQRVGPGWPMTNLINEGEVGLKV